ncbi:MAG: hypothetical protein KGR26_07935, partial [Cyanobacteria bacterium REEB65]|nr:hypothetical protein [Cyanobacteria bacterium REEB65]
RSDPVTGERVPVYDTNPAKAWGELITILDHRDRSTRRAQYVLEHVRRKLEAEDFGPDDWIIPMGDPGLIGIVSVVAAERCGRLRMLLWNNGQETYDETIIDLEPQGKSAAPGARKA